MMGVAERQSIIRVPRGLFALRYAEAADSFAPTIFFRPRQGFERSLDTLACPGEQKWELRRPGQIAILSADVDAEVEVTVRQSETGRSLDCGIRLEPLQVASLAPAGAADPALAPAAPFANALRGVVGHLARIGDVRCAPGEWLGGPNEPAQIEGLQFDLDPTMRDLVQVQVLIGRDPAWTAWVPGTDYSGTKGRATPLSGVRLRVNPSSASLELVASAIFLGSAVQRAEGAQVEFRSSAGWDPLIGINVALRLRRSERSVEDMRRSVNESSIERSRGRVRVFRAGVEQIAS